ncbi:MAG: efflux RND transporter periplasmic adaptor subunit [Desulfovibrionaceae bacterium]
MPRIARRRSRHSLHPLQARLVRLAAMSVLALALCAGCGDSDKQADEQTMPGPPVQVAEVTEKTVTETYEYVGQTQAVQNVEVRARVEGFLQKRLFKEGSIVEQNQTLFIIQPDQYRDQLAEAKAQLARDKAALQKARTDYGRFKTLVDQGAVSREAYDTVATKLKEAIATVQQDEAQVHTAKLNLDYCTVQAPTTGRIGRTQEDIGALVGKGENTLLATISELDPIYVNFSISEKEYLELLRYAKTMKEAKKVADKEYKLPLQLILADGSLYEYNGTSDMADRAVDAQTGSLGVRAVFPNPNGALRPGQYAKIRLHRDMDTKMPVIPQVAVMDVQGQKLVYVVDANNTIQSRPITTGQRTGGDIVVEKGLKPGDQVVAQGVQKVKPGMKVTPTPYKPDGDGNASRDQEG